MDAKEFLEATQCLNEELKLQIEEMDFPYPSAIKIDKSQNIALAVSNLLEKFKTQISKTFGSSIIYIIGELTDNIEQHSGYSNAFVLVNLPVPRAQGIFR